VDRGGLLVGLGGTTPDHDQTVAAVFDTEVLDVVDEGLGLIPLGGDVLHPHTIEPGDPALVEHRVHGRDAFQLAGNLRQVGAFEHTGGAGCFEGVGRDWVPAAEHQIIELGQRHEFADLRIAVFVAGAETDVGHLGDRADGGVEALPGGEHAGHEG